MTLNKIINTFKVFAEAHQMINTFWYGDPTDLMATRDVQYPAMCLYLNDGIDIAGTTLPFKIVLMDLVHQVQEAEGNYQDVESDLLEIGKDVIAMVRYKGKQDADFMPSKSNPARFTDPKNEDLALALVIDCTITTMYNANRCQVPATDYEFTDTSNPEIVLTYRKTINAESSTFVIPSLSYRYIVAVVLGTANLTPKTGEGEPDIMQYKYDVATGTFTTGVEAQVGQILQIIHRAI